MEGRYVENVIRLTMSLIESIIAKKYVNINRRANTEKLNFDDIHCRNTEKVLNVVRAILSIWDLERGRNEM